MVPCFFVCLCFLWGASPFLWHFICENLVRSGVRIVYFRKHLYFFLPGTNWELSKWYSLLEAFWTTQTLRIKTASLPVIQPEVSNSQAGFLFLCSVLGFQTILSWTQERDSWWRGRFSWQNPSVGQAGAWSSVSHASWGHLAWGWAVPGVADSTG